MFVCARWCLGVQVNQTVLTLNLEMNSIGPEGAASLAEALTVLTRNVAYLIVFFGGLRSRCLYSPEDDLRWFVD